MLNVCIIHYNTPEITSYLIRSINKFVKEECRIYIFDNSDRYPFTYRQDNITYIDNTQGQVIDFNKWLLKYPKPKGTRGYLSNYGSAKHSISVQKCIELINDNFILLDSDILLKKDISQLCTETGYFAGEIGYSDIISDKRVFPYCCYLNVKKMVASGITYFNEDKILGLKPESNRYDTGYWLYEQAKDLPHTNVHLDDYIVHFRGGSWRKTGDKNVNNWLQEHKGLWLEEKIIVTMTTWKNRVGNVPHVIDTIYGQTILPDKIVINLSEEEFKGECPEPLRTYAANHDDIEIHWIGGRNIRQWKKLIPTLFRYPNDCVICIDDDREYPKDFIESLWTSHLNSPDNPITTNPGYRLLGVLLQHAGHGTLSKLEHFDAFKGIDLDDMYNFASSDTFFTLIAHRSNHDVIRADRIPNINMYNEVSPLREIQGTYNTKTQKLVYNHLVEKGYIDRLDKNKAAENTSCSRREKLEDIYLRFKERFHRNYNAWKAGTQAHQTVLAGKDGILLDGNVKENQKIEEIETR